MLPKFIPKPGEVGGS